jgi:hypothetical protein
MRLDAVAIALLGHDIGQAHVFGIVVFDGIAVCVLFFRHGQTHIFLVWVLNGKACRIIGPRRWNQKLTQSEEQINQDFHSAIQSVGVISMIPQANWVDNEVLPEVCPFMSSHRSFHV